jgi:hypothetical protein
MPSKKTAEIAQLSSCFCWFLAWLILQYRRWRQYITAKRQALSKLCNFAIQKPIRFIVTAVRKSNPTSATVFFLKVAST